MRLGPSPHLDALCGEYLLGTLQGAARRRFERALAQEPLVASRLASWRNVVIPQPAEAERMQPDARLWQRIARDLSLHRYRTPWYARVGLWRGWALAATTALVVWSGVALVSFEPAMAPLATLASTTGQARLSVAMSSDRRWLQLTSTRTVQAGPGQSFELWLLPADGSAPRSMAVLGELGGRVAVPAPLRDRLGAGVKLAVSVEPPGGSPTGAPTGPVILVGAVAPG
ncbi:hypothetical protein G3580_16560 [Nitrogeniibacter mangrovi]|uniref:Anti-sigma K factor RskA C-terminal domain-containing protein n=1 Tax=Nitrogeniibacter mangrovi TaxID=2016596 RepID=A0A6C1B9Z3_9RHOO|nr:anti-sigma factor [Nitrogeniibacter mangrovi]QID19084.1 hypothetical protein G3580_16560 [Nitrogeniibacter mangrovi]